jgi:agmatine/peptidylarginine deiminase
MGTDTSSNHYLGWPNDDPERNREKCYQECRVLIITSNPAAVTDQLLNSGISLDSVQFIETPFNSIWVCDYGPTAVYSTGNDSLYLIDWIYKSSPA